MPWGDGTPPDRLSDLPQVTNAELANALAELFRSSGSVPGGTAGAVRWERMIGDGVGGRRHEQKARERARQLRRLITGDRLSPEDRALALWVMTDLERALDGRTRC